MVTEMVDALTEADDHGVSGAVTAAENGKGSTPRPSQTCIKPIGLYEQRQFINGSSSELAKVTTFIRSHVELHAAPRASRSVQDALPCDIENVCQLPPKKRPSSRSNHNESFKHQRTKSNHDPSAILMESSNSCFLLATIGRKISRERSIQNDIQDHRRLDFSKGTPPCSAVLNTTIVTRTDQLLM